jgi:hypothetical protein
MLNINHTVLQNNLKCVKVTDFTEFLESNTLFKEIMNMLFVYDTEFYSKLRIMLKKIFFDLVSSLKEKLINLIYKEEKGSPTIDK